MTTSQLRDLIKELASLAPNFIEVKELPVRGTPTTFVKCIAPKLQTFGVMSEIKAQLNAQSSE